MKLKWNNLFTLLVVVILSASCQEDLSSTAKKQPAEEKQQSKVEIIESVNTTIDLWHKAAAEANFDAYFNLMTANAVFIGTDASENWQLTDFKSYSKPYFDKGKAWSFTAIDRNIYVSEDLQSVWFDELLDTQMKICRGSGVLKRENKQWKIAHYVLSATIPNDKMKAVIDLKSESDSLWVKQFVINKLNAR